jgi:dTDP-3-amino-3,4,6-trideoxy-alpha-D-glucose transaminase
VKVPFADLGRATQGVRPDLDAAIGRVLGSGWFVLGREGAAFEDEFAAWVGTPHAVACASGTDAIELALRALDVGPGDEVVTQANTCVPTVAAIARTGATPVLCDAESAGATMDPESLERAISARTRAIVPVHLYGQCADLDAIGRVAGSIPIVEDCAQAHGARFGENRAGTMGALGAFSFYPTKNLGALGDAGAVVTNDDDMAQRLRLLRQYGQNDRYHHQTEGVNSRLDELQAAILRAKLPHVAPGNERRRAIAASYAAALEGTRVCPLTILAGRENVFHLFVVRVADREGFRERLAAKGVDTIVHYPVPIHKHPPYASLAHGRTDLTVSETLAGEVVSLPIFPELTDAEVDHVADAAREAAALA